ncbi:MAG: hypothetical protein ACLRMJ_03705 [Alistipes finegoldii]
MLYTLKNLYTYKMMIATEGVTDLMYIASGTQDAQLDISPSQPRFAPTWTYGYRGVMYCNMAVTGIENSPIDERTATASWPKPRCCARSTHLLTTSSATCPSHGRRLRPRSARPRGQTAAHVGRGDAHRADRGPRIVSGRTALIRTSEAAGNRAGAAGPHAHRQTRHVEQGLRQGARSHRRAGTDLRRRPLGLPGFGYSVPDEEHAQSIFEVQHTYTAGGLIYTSNVASICMPYRATATTSTRTW